MIDLGGGITAELVAHQSCCAADLPDGGTVGVAVFHPSLTDDAGTRCELHAFWDVSRWPHANQVTLVALEPLTVAEPLRCEGCGWAGRIVGGQWEPSP